MDLGRTQKFRATNLAGMSAGFYASPLLWVGEPPSTVAPWIRGVHAVETPHEAARVIGLGHLACVPSAWVAQQTMLLVGSQAKAAMYSTGGYEHRWDEGLGVQ